MNYGFEGKVALVTGASGGIGRATARAFARSGAAVLVADVNDAGGNETVELIDSEGGQSVFQKCDVSKGADVHAMVARAVSEFGRLDFAHNNAGINSVMADEWDDDVWNRSIAINLSGVMQCMKAEAEVMLAQGGGAIVNTASINGLVGLKPTVGLVSRTHVVPISHSQDTPGPMARTVRDAAMILTVIAGSDAADGATALADRQKRDYASALTGSIKDVRIGVLREEIGRQPATRAVFEAALVTLKAAGAVLVDIEKTGAPEGLGDAETIVLHTELKADLNAYLATTPKTVKTRTLADVIAFNIKNADAEMPYFGQETFIAAEATKGLTDPAYLKALADSGNGARATLTRLLKDNNVAMLVAPTMGPAWISDPVNGDQYDGPSASQLPAVSGFPHLTVPMGQISGLPVGLSFIGPAFGEAALLNAGDVYEQARGPLPGPTYRASVPVR